MGNSVGQQERRMRKQEGISRWRRRKIASDWQNVSRKQCLILWPSYGRLMKLLRAS
jgi:hypothetical protein